MRAVQARIKRAYDFDFPFDAHIDNVRWFAESKERLDQVTRMVFEVAVEFQVEFNETVTQVLEHGGQRYDFLGVDYDHVTQSTALTTSFKEKLEHAAGFLHLPFSDMGEVSLRNL